MNNLIIPRMVCTMQPTKVGIDQKGDHIYLLSFFELDTWKGEITTRHKVVQNLYAGKHMELFQGELKDCMCYIQDMAENVLVAEL